MKDQELAEFYRQIASLIKSGVPLLRSLESLTKEGPTEARSLAAKLKLAVEQGDTLSEACAKEDFFKPYHINLIGAGELSGRLPEILIKQANSMDRMAALRKQLIAALIYPALVFHLTVIVFALFMSMMDLSGKKFGFNPNPVKGIIILIHYHPITLRFDSFSL